MTPRFRMIAGPNGSGKTTLAARYDHAAIPYLSRAYFFDNSGQEMLYLASFAEGEGLTTMLPESQMPRWFSDSLTTAK